jgi:phosphate transport system permease protein
MTDRTTRVDPQKGTPIDDKPDDRLLRFDLGAGATSETSTASESDATPPSGDGPDRTTVDTPDDSPGISATRPHSRRGDRVFAWLTSGSAALVIAIVVLIATFLLVKAVPSIIHDKANFFFSTQWSVSNNDLRFGIAYLTYTTVLMSVVALVIAVPIAVVILAPKLSPIQHALQHLSWIPIFKPVFDTKTVFDAAVVLTVMILPIITAIARDVFERTPTANKEAALALGATRWEMIRMAVLPYGRPGVVSGAMLGLGRALGETIAVLFILGKVAKFSPSLFNGGETFASKIAGSLDGFGQHPGPYLAAGLTLFVLTFIVNGLARAIVNRRKDFR